MPELPEVQTVVNGIKSKLIGLKIKDTEVFVKKLRYPVPINLKNKINKSSLLDVERRAKYIILRLSNDYSLIIHLGMSGRLIIGKKKELKSIKHTHFQLYFSFSSRTCLFIITNQVLDRFFSCLSFCCNN